MPYSVHKGRVFDAQPNETSASGLPSAKLIGFDAPLATSMTASTVPWHGPGTTVAIFDPSGDRLASSPLSRLPKAVAASASLICCDDAGQALASRDTAATPNQMSLPARKSTGGGKVVHSV